MDGSSHSPGSTQIRSSYDAFRLRNASVSPSLLLVACPIRFLYKRYVTPSASLAPHDLSVRRLSICHSTALGHPPLPTSLSRRKLVSLHSGTGSFTRAGGWRAPVPVSEPCGVPSAAEGRRSACASQSCPGCKPRGRRDQPGGEWAATAGEGGELRLSLRIIQIPSKTSHLLFPLILPENDRSQPGFASAEAAGSLDSRAPSHPRRRHVLPKQRLTAVAGTGGGPPWTLDPDTP